MSRPELGVTFTKLHCWTFTNYEKCVFLDADTLVNIIFRIKYRFPETKCLCPKKYFLQEKKLILL